MATVLRQGTMKNYYSTERRIKKFLKEELSVGEYFRLNNEQMDAIIKEVLDAVRQWKKIANKLGISRAEQELMASAFVDG